MGGFVCFLAAMVIIWLPLAVFLTGRPDRNVAVFHALLFFAFFALILGTFQESDERVLLAVLVFGAGIYTAWIAPKSRTRNCAAGSV
jgi:uncharacterized membrane protein